MDEHESARGGGDKKVSKRKRRYSDANANSWGKPWWLVVFLVLVLIFFGTYISWLNSPQADQYESFGSFIFGPRITEVLPENQENLNTSLTSEDLALSEMALPIHDSIDDTWVSEVPMEIPEATKTFPEAEPQKEAESKKVVPAPIVTKASEPEPIAVARKTTYHINAGEFSARSSALDRMRELRQGNYQPQLLEPSRGSGKYQVTVGEFDSFASAREQARTIDFILEIKTSVEKKQ